MTPTRAPAVLAMTKIVVADLDRVGAFYTALCGFEIVDRIGDASFTEIIMRPPGAASAALVLITYTGQPVPPPGECILVFETPDIDAFVARAVTAGGTVTQPPQHIAALALSYAFVQDPEGHIVEAIQRS